jgi:hypothetical protein
MERLRVPEEGEAGKDGAGGIGDKHVLGSTDITALEQNKGICSSKGDGCGKIGTEMSCDKSRLQFMRLVRAKQGKNDFLKRKS